jgi:mono/diheme cytochrome c family protein
MLYGGVNLADVFTMRCHHHLISAAILLVACWGGLRLAANELLPPGAEIYSKQCAECHGDHGQGVAAKYEDSLQSERSLASLTRYIDRFMPDEAPEKLDAAESKQVAEYIMATFYHQAPEKVALARLTGRQFQESVADLIASFAAAPQPSAEAGLMGEYFRSVGMEHQQKKILTRRDRQLDFDFGTQAPAKGMAADQFSIWWQGALRVPQTGWYEFRLTSPNGVKFFLNSDWGEHRAPLIDGWVHTTAETRTLSAKLFLLGGRRYPLNLDFFKFQEARGAVRVEWKPPLGDWQILAEPFLSPVEVGEVMVLRTVFPADDASEGYERGTGVGKAWLEAVTAAAVEVAAHVVARLPDLSGVKNEAPDAAAGLQKFIGTFASRAFRRPLTATQQHRYVERIFAAETDPVQAVKRAVIQILGSPYFLYPELAEGNDDYTVAARLALVAYDSLPDQELLELAAAGELRQPDQVAVQAQRLLADPRAKAKLAGFFNRWLKLDVTAELTKNPALYPGFSAGLVADLRRSLELFVEEVVWSPASDYRRLFTADDLWLNERLAAFYGAKVLPRAGFQKVILNPGQRAGIITHPYLLARLAHPQETAPILRGVFLVRNVLGGVLRPPSEAIVFNDGQFEAAMTTREKVTQLTANRSCMTCHEMINPLGFALEKFDAVGRMRLTDRERAVEAEADFESIDGGKVRLKGARDVALQTLNSPSARQGFVRHLFQAMVQQNPKAYGAATLSELEQDFVASGYHVRDLVAEMNRLAALRGIDAANLTKP